MTAASWVALWAFGVLAVADWIAVAREARRAEYLWKPAALCALIGVAVLLDPTHEGQRWWFVGALSLSVTGDVFLMLPDDRFVEGLGAFLLAHVAYTVGLNLHEGSTVALAASGAGVAVVAVPLGTRVVHGARGHDPRLAVPVTTYVVVISAMVTSALASGSSWAIAGAVLFYCSDALIGWSRFVRSFPRERVAIMVTYHLGQAGLVASLLS